MAKAKAKRSSATRKKATRKKPTRKTARVKGSARKRLQPRKQKRGLVATEAPLEVGAPPLRPLAEQVRALGGTPVGAYREPLSGRPLLLAVLPLEAVEPTPFQRDLSPTHTRRLAGKIEESGSFLDPLTVVRGADGKLWTPNGRHRLAAAKLLGLRSITALISPDEDLAFRILALNTEKVHNLKDRSLEVIRMARELAGRHPRARETDYEEQFESAAYLTLGLVYEREGRFAGGAYQPMLRRVDRFQRKALKKSLSERAGFAARLIEIDGLVVDAIEKLRARGFRSPYLRNLIVARINPVRFIRPKRGDDKPPMTLAASLTRMTAAAKRFDPERVRESDLALVAASAPEEAD